MKAVEEQIPTRIMLTAGFFVVMLIGIWMASGQPSPPRVSLVSSDSIHVEGHGVMRIDSLRHAESLTGHEQLHVMQEAASHLAAYKMGYNDAVSTHPDQQDLLWLARAAYVEARSDGLYSMYLVASVIMNRVRSERYPGTVKQVVLDPAQITGMYDQRYIWKTTNMDMEATAWRNALRAAHLALTTPDRLRPFEADVYHYYSPVSMNPVGRVPHWAVGHTPVYQIGDRFVFYAGIS